MAPLKLRGTSAKRRRSGREPFDTASTASGRNVSAIVSRFDCASDEVSAIVRLPHVVGLSAPILYAVPLQLLAYHAALQKGTDVDQPRNLAKSVTVE